MSSAESYLRQFADLDRFWILRMADFQSGLIHYVDSRGVAFAMMDDNDARAEECIQFLESRGCPVFDDVHAMDRYAQSFADRR